MPTSGTVLVVDDEDAIRDGCRQALQAEGLRVLEAASSLEALEVMAKSSCHVAILDLRMPGMGGMELLKRIKSEHNHVTVIVITGYASVETAVEAMKWGAIDYIPKPFDAASLRMAVRRALLGETDAESASSGGPRGAGPASRAPRLIGKTPEMQRLRELIERVARTDSTVLIMGESGTGKEIVARALHENSKRAAGPFVVVDCTTLVGALMENELFGHAKGSYTGASSTTHGCFETADGGTLFLDEVGCLDVSLQSKLLRAIERKEFSRVGSSETISVDVRVIAATNMDLVKAVEEGKFRDDLYYRLSVVPIILPPLRHRKEDIPLLAEHFLNLHARNRRKQVTRINPEAMEVLMAHHWPGNVRELSNAIERAVVLAEGEEIVPELLLHYGFTHRPARGPQGDRTLTLADAERALIERALRATGGKKGRAAELLGIDRKTLWRKLRQQGEMGR